MTAAWLSRAPGFTRYNGDTLIKMFQVIGIAETLLIMYYAFYFALISSIEE
jgi:hypothetical protein